MTPVSIAAFLISIAAISLVWTKVTIERLLLSLFLAGAHIAAAVFAYRYSFSAASDSTAYYLDPYNQGVGSWGLGTIFVIKICHLLKTGLGASYLDCFLLFQTFGFAGLMILARLFVEIEGRLGVPEHRGYWLLLFLPSANYWTASIGKDAPVFFGISLCLWAAMDLRPRVVAFCISLIVLVAFRAHVALMAATALAAASIFGSSLTLGRKAALAAVGIIGIAVTAGAVQSSIGVNAASLSSMSDFFEQQSDIYSTVGGTTSIGDASFPLKVVSLLFRPLFFDAHGVMGIIASAENVGWIALFLYCLVRWRDVSHLVRRVLFIRFALIFAFILLFLMSLLYYNVGLGLRERVMAYPMIYCALVSLWCLRQKRSLMRSAAGPHALMLDPKAHRPVPEL